MAADVLRGIAVLGILLVNMRFFSQPLTLEVLGEPLWDRPVDRWVNGLIRFFAEGKFYSLFSFLFGWGFSVLLERAEARGAQGDALYRRRLGLLFGIGVLHIVLLWAGDILVLYALLGFTLPGFRWLSDRELVHWIIGLFLFPILLTGLLLAAEQVAGGTRGPTSAPVEAPAGWAESDGPDASPLEDWFRELGERARRVYPQGTFPEMVTQRLVEYGLMFAGWFLMGGAAFHILALFLLGLLAGRRRWIHEWEGRAELWRRGSLRLLPVALAANLLLVWGAAEGGPGPTLRSWIGTVSGLIGGPALSAVYVAAVLLWMRRARVRNALERWLAPVGRMALTNYLLQSVICGTIFYGYGLGLFGSIGAPEGLALTFAIFLVQIGFSRAWLSRFHFGPVEWVWRALTYRTRPPLRVEKVDAP